jgi:hypothetical protein
VNVIAVSTCVNYHRLLMPGPLLLFFRRTALLHTWVGQGGGLCNSVLCEYQRAVDRLFPGVDSGTVLAILLGKCPRACLLALLPPLPTWCTPSSASG